MDRTQTEIQQALESGLTPGNPTVLHDFPAHKTDLTERHRSHIDDLVRKIGESFGQRRQVWEVVIIGHAATFRGISKEEYGRRALARAENAGTYLHSRLVELDLDKQISIRTEHQSNDVPLVDNMVSSTGRKARQHRSINRRVEIAFNYRYSSPYHRMLGPGIHVSQVMNRSPNEIEGLADVLKLEENASPECIDESRRASIPDASRPPMRWICSIEVSFQDPDEPGKLTSFGMAATGLLISPRHILTAGHVLHDFIWGTKGTKQLKDAVYVRVCPGMNGRPISLPFGGYYAQFQRIEGQPIKRSLRGRFWVPRAWRSDKDPGADIGLIKLPLVRGKQIGKLQFGDGKLGWWGHRNFRPKTIISPVGKQRLEDRRISLLGYPLDKQLVGKKNKEKKALTYPQWVSHGTSSASSFKDWLENHPSLKNRPIKNGRRLTSNDILVYNACTIRGNSGSPVWVTGRDKTLNLVAVHSNGLHAKGGPYEYGCGVRLSSKILKLLKKWISI
jgi:V8-like Glu-specific endopeptidase